MNKNLIYTPNHRFSNNRFLGPFILGGITGGLLAPNFYRPIPIFPQPIIYGNPIYRPVPYQFY